MVQIKAVPTSVCQEYGKVAGASVEIYVATISMIDAVQKANAYLIDIGWKLEEELTALKMTPERISLLDEFGLKAFRQAEKEGLGSFFAAWPVEERSDGMVEIRPANVSSVIEDTRH